MKPSVMLRITAVITLLYFAAHTAGIPWTPVQGAGEMAVLEAMKTHRFNVEGFTRAYWDFYFGFGVAISGYLLVQAVALWQLASLAKSEAVRFRPILASFFVAFVFNAVVAWKYFFPVPAVFAAAIATCLGLAFLAAKKVPDLGSRRP
jgi:hypothetical protein